MVLRCTVIPATWTQEKTLTMRDYGAKDSFSINIKLAVLKLPLPWSSMKIISAAISVKYSLKETEEPFNHNQWKMSHFWTILKPEYLVQKVLCCHKDKKLGGGKKFFATSPLQNAFVTLPLKCFCNLNPCQKFATHPPKFFCHSTPKFFLPHHFP